MNWKILALMGLMACGSPENLVSQEQDIKRNLPYVDLEDWAAKAGPEMEMKFWVGKNKLTQEFNEICGDTFCSGDISNITPLSFRCSVSASEMIKKCKWFFSGTQDRMVPSTGDIHPRFKNYECTVWIHGRAQDLIDTLAQPGSIWRRVLPGGMTIQRALSECF